ncbi:transposase [Lysinibacillus sphaericus]|uniref:Transposase n=1 Tax=Lysinibacillus sphaericus TaxID=1421 RepID=A0A544U9C0_LYSSH|nr:transposase [Lysinibacillus sp. SDF0037]
MTIVKQMSLFDIQELMEMESSRRFDAIFATFDVQPIFQLFSKKTLRGAPRELNYGAMIQSLIIRIVERIPTIKGLIKRLVNDPLFRLDCGFLVSDIVPSEASYSRMIDVISQSDVLEVMQDTLIQIAMTEGFLHDEHLAIDGYRFWGEARFLVFYLP